MAPYIVGFDDLVTSFVATIATGWSDPCRVGLSPTGKPRLYAAHEKDGLAAGNLTRGGGQNWTPIGGQRCALFDIQSCDARDKGLMEVLVDGEGLMCA